MTYSGEINFDGIIGPTHNYAGLSQGNLASQKNLNQTSNPQAAALQGLDKMRLIMEQGIPQGFFLPHERPHLPTLRNLDLEALMRRSLIKWLKKIQLY